MGALNPDLKLFLFLTNCSFLLYVSLFPLSSLPSLSFPSLIQWWSKLSEAERTREYELNITDKLKLRNVK